MRVTCTPVFLAVFFFPTGNLTGHEGIELAIPVVKEIITNQKDFTQRSRLSSMKEKYKTNAERIQHHLTKDA